MGCFYLRPPQAAASARSVRPHPSLESALFPPKELARLRRDAMLPNPLPPAANRTLRRGIVASAVVIAAALGATGRVLSQEMPAPSRTMLVAVSDSVHLEVVDWGGEGPTL